MQHSDDFPHWSGGRGRFDRMNRIDRMPTRCPRSGIYPVDPVHPVPPVKSSDPCGRQRSRTSGDLRASVPCMFPKPSSEVSMRSAISRAGQPSKTRSAADRLCHGVAGVNPAKAVTKPDRRRSLDSRPHSRLSRVSDSSATSSYPPERDISRNDLAWNDSKVDMPNSAQVPSMASLSGSVVNLCRLS